VIAKAWVLVAHPGALDRRIAVKNNRVFIQDYMNIDRIKQYQTWARIMMAMSWICVAYCLVSYPLGFVVTGGMVDSAFGIPGASMFASQLTCCAPPLGVLCGFGATLLGWNDRSLRHSAIASTILCVLFVVAFSVIQIYLAPAGSWD
jgi:hypothetical protein